MSLELLLSVAFGGSLLTYVLGKISSRLRDGFAVTVSLALVVMVGLLYGREFETPLQLGFLGVRLALRMNMLSWFFAATIVGIGLLSIVFSLRYMSGRGRLDYYYSTVLFINACMLGTVVAGDLLSFFFLWEMMSWSTFLLISFKGGKAVFAGLKYIIMSIIGSLAMLFAIISLYAAFSTLNITELASLIQAAPAGYV